MAKYSRLKVFTTMIETGLVPIFYNEDVDVAVKIVQACLDGGVRCIEFTNRGDLAHDVFGELMRHFQNDERAILGVGTVIDTGTAAIYIQLGANFVVGPIFNSEVARVCNRRKVAYIPGCDGPSEISEAEELGAEICKIFPGSRFGPGFIKSVHAPMPWTRIMPTGGVTPKEENVRGWLEAGAACVAMGSKLITKEAVAAGDYKAITDKVRQVLDWIIDVRKDHASVI